MSESGNSVSSSDRSEPVHDLGQTVAAEPKVRFERMGAVMRLVLDRGKVLNAFDHEMTDAVLQDIPRIARNPDIYVVTLSSTSGKAFCAGGDVRALSAVARSDMATARRYFASEYRMNWMLECFSKPTVSFINGICMGSGAGLTCYNTHRVAGENYRWAMPETALGLFPDVGVAHVLAHLPWPMGLYLGLTGTPLGQADGRWLGIASHAIASAKFSEIEAAFADCQTIDPVLDELDDASQVGPLQKAWPMIEDVFSAPDLGAILAKLDRPSEASQAWADATRQAFVKRSPLSLAITDRHIRSARHLDLRQTLIQDYRLAVRCLEDHDFHEGVRALIVDKDKAPKWSPATLDAVTAGKLDAYFAPLGADDLALPSREEMQAAR